MIYFRDQKTLYTNTSALVLWEKSMEHWELGCIHAVAHYAWLAEAASVDMFEHLAERLYSLLEDINSSLLCLANESSELGQVLKPATA